MSEELYQEEPKKFWKKAKSAFSKAKLSRYLGLCGVLAMTVALSLWQIGWNPEKIGWEIFIANTSFLLFLGIYGIFFGENEGTNLFKNIITGIFQVSRDLFLDVVDEIVGLGYVDALPDYIGWRYKKDYENECKLRLLSVRLFNLDILDLKDDEIEELHKHPIEHNNGVYFSRLSDEQYEIVKNIKEGKLFVDYIEDYNFYLVEDTEECEPMVTRVKRANVRKAKISWQQRISRVIMIALLSFIVAGFFRKVVENGGDPIAEAEANFQAIKDLVSRLSTLLVSIASGISTARLLNKEDVFVLKYKTSYNKVFVACMKNGTYSPINYQEKAKRDYEEYKLKQESKE